MAGRPDGIEIPLGEVVGRFVEQPVGGTRGHPAFRLDNDHRIAPRLQASRKAVATVGHEGAAAVDEEAHIGTRPAGRTVNGRVFCRHAPHVGGT